MLKITNLAAIAVLLVAGDPSDPANVHVLQPGDELTTDKLPVAIADEAQAEIQERRSQGHPMTGRRQGDQPRQPMGHRSAHARDPRARDPRAPAGNSGGGTGGHDDGSGVKKDQAGQHVEGDKGAATQARDKGKA